MGLDFIRRAAPSFVKKWDRGAEHLKQPRLFSKSEAGHARTMLAHFDTSDATPVGKELVVFKEGPRLVLVDGLNRVGAIDSPTAEVMQKLEESGCYAVGRITAKYPLSGTGNVEVE